MAGLEKSKHTLLGKLPGGKGIRQVAEATVLETFKANLNNNEKKEFERLYKKKEFGNAINIVAKKMANTPTEEIRNKMENSVTQNYQKLQSLNNQELSSLIKRNGEQPSSGKKEEK